MRVMTGQQQKAAKWKECAPAPLHYMPLAIGSLYVEHHFDTEDKKEALNMIDKLLASFEQIVQRIDWMDSNTKQTAIQKAPFNTLFHYVPIAAYFIPLSANQFYQHAWFCHLARTDYLYYYNFLL